MSESKQPRITNIWSKITADESGKLFTKVVIESTGAFAYKAGERGSDILLEAANVVLNMPAGSIEVDDGLVSRINLEQTGLDTAVISIKAEHPCSYDVEFLEGLPSRIAVTLDRSFLNKLLKDRKIVIDPGHGGEDVGGRGPVNLVEKNVVMLITRELVDIFEKNGAKTILTREKDEQLPFKNRIDIVKREKADLYLGVHTHSSSDSKVGGSAVRYRQNCQRSSDLAELIGKNLVRKLKLRNRGLKESGRYAVLDGVPAVEVEVVTITNWVEEGLLRSPTVHKKAAQGIFNGVKEYFAAVNKQ